MNLLKLNVFKDKSFLFIEITRKKNKIIIILFLIFIIFHTLSLIKTCDLAVKMYFGQITYVMYYFHLQMLFINIESIMKKTSKSLTQKPHSPTILNFFGTGNIVLVNLSVFPFRRATREINTRHLYT